MPGIRGVVDFNVFQGNFESLQALRIPAARHCPPRAISARAPKPALPARMQKVARPERRFGTHNRAGCHDNRRLQMAYILLLSHLGVLLHHLAVVLAILLAFIHRLAFLLHHLAVGLLVFFHHLAIALLGMSSQKSERKRRPQPFSGGFSWLIKEKG